MADLSNAEAPKGKWVSKGPGQGHKWVPDEPPAVNEARQSDDAVACEDCREADATHNTNPMDTLQGVWVCEACAKQRKGEVEKVITSYRSSAAVHPPDPLTRIADALERIAANMERDSNSRRFTEAAMLAASTKAKRLPKEPNPPRGEY